MDLGATGPEKPKKLTPKQKKFVELLSSDPSLSQTEAAKQAGFKNARQSGSQLLTLPEFSHVKVELDWLKAERAQKLGITSQRVLERLAELAFTDPRDCFERDGQPKNFTKLSREQAALLGESKLTWTVVKIQHAAGEDGKPWIETVLKPNMQVKIRDPLPAVKLLMKHLGLLVERVQINVNEKAAAAQKEVDDLFERLTGAAVQELTGKAAATAATQTSTVRTPQEQAEAEVAAILAAQKPAEPTEPTEPTE